MRALLDVNVLIALFDEAHSHNKIAHAWLGSNLAEGWASCPLTENGLVRIMSSPNYTLEYRQSPAEVTIRLREFIEKTDHAFWHDTVSLRDPTRFQIDRLVTGKHLTDLYLLGLSVENDGRLVTFDRGIPTGAVTGAAPRHLKVL